MALGIHERTAAGRGKCLGGAMTDWEEDQAWDLMNQDEAVRIYIITSRALLDRDPHEKKS